MSKAKLLTFIWKRQTVSGKRGENIISYPDLLNLRKEHLVKSILMA